MSSYNVDKNAGLIIGDGDFSVVNGTLDITENGVYDVTAYKNVDVDYNVKNEDVTVTPELYEQEITPSVGYDGLGVVRVESRPINLQSKQVAPSELTTFVTADVGYDGLSSVTVDNVNAEQLGFEKEYYAVGHTFMGLEGTYNPFPEQSVGGIYITEVGENNYPRKVLFKNIEHSPASVSYPFSKNISAKGALREIIFDNCPEITSMPNQWLNDFSYVTKIVFPTNLISIGVQAFQGYSSLKEIIFPNSLQSIGQAAFYNCTSLTELTLPDSLTSIGQQAFYNCTSLTELTLAQGFNCNGLDVHWSTRLTAETIAACLEALADRTGQTAYTITFGSTNLNKLSAEQIAIATNKNWNLN